MSLAPSERKSWGPLIATIDLLFLVVAFFTLLLFFVQKERAQTQVRLNQVEESLAAALPPSAETEEQRGNALVTLVERLMTVQKAEQLREVQAQQREERRKTRPTMRVNYQVLPGGKILYDGQTYTPAEFKAHVIDPSRQGSWLAIRAHAPPETPFGEVVAMRKLLLENGGEFDTYWDNLAEAGNGPVNSAAGSQARGR
jgi:hypothetical protein